jgi:GWxTD domain-containing protein
MSVKKRLLVGAVLAAWVCLSAPRSGATPGTKLDPESEKFYQTAQLIMTGEEKKIFKHLPDAASRKEFIKDFWDKRDPNPDTPENEFKKEFEARVEYANKHFREGGLGMNTDRGRIYIFMGKPDKVEEYYNRAGSGIRGSIIQWFYYNYGLGIEFVDERGIGEFRMRDYTGDFFEAMDLFKLGQSVGPDSVFKQPVVKFNVKYDASRKELEVIFPAKDIFFRENGEGELQVDLDFKIYIYPDEGATKETFEESQFFVTTESELEKLKTVSFRFAHALKPGKNFVDVIAKGKPGTTGKVRRIFEIKVNS